MPTEAPQKLDVTRLNRVERRRMKKNFRVVIPGRNLPYVKSVHKTVENYYALRAKELEQDTKNNGNKTD